MQPPPTTLAAHGHPAARDRFGRSASCACPPSDSSEAHGR